jgi:hypothetical protein
MKSTSMRNRFKAAVLITNDKVVTNNTNNTVNIITKDKVEDYETIKSGLTVESKKIIARFFKWVDKSKNEIGRYWWRAEEDIKDQKS